MSESWKKMKKDVKVDSGMVGILKEPMGVILVD